MQNDIIYHFSSKCISNTLYFFQIMRFGGLNFCSRSFNFFDMNQSLEFFDTWILRSCPAETTDFFWPFEIYLNYIAFLACSGNQNCYFSHVKIAFLLHVIAPHIITYPLVVVSWKTLNIISYYPSQWFKYHPNHLD